MSVFINALSELCKEHLLSEKWLITPNRRVGFQIIDRITLSGQSIVNLHIKTINKLVKDIVDISFPDKAGQHLQALHQEILIGELFQGLKQKGLGYLSGLKPGSGLFSHLLTALIELRKVHIHSSQINARVFEEVVKGKEIIFLLKEYEKALESLDLYDYPGALMKALTCITSGSYVPGPDTIIILARDIFEYEFCTLEKKLLQAFPPGQVKILPYDDPEKNAEIHETDVSLLGAVLNPFKAQSPKKDGTLELYAAYGLVNEVKEVFRRIVNRGIPFDQVEVLHTDAQTYVPLIFEIAHQFSDEQSKAIPVTFADGLPVSLFRPARALKGWISWILHDFPQYQVRRMIQDGLLTLTEPAHTGESENAGEAKSMDTYVCTIARYFRHIGIGKGRARYSPALSKAVNDIETQLFHISILKDEDEIDFIKRKHRLEQKLMYLKELKDFILELLSNTPDPETDHGIIVEKVLWFLEHMVRRTSELDKYTAKLLRERISELKGYIDSGIVHQGFDIWNWLSLLASDIPVYGHGPREGHLFVSPLFSGGYSGRKYTFILGFDESRFPGSGFYDPILLDQERCLISEDIPKTADIPGNKMEGICRLFGRLRGNVTLSYSSMDIPKNRELFPSSVFLSAFRIASGNHEADYEKLATHLGPPVSFAPAHTDASATVDEWWLGTLCGKHNGGYPEQISSRTALISITYPNLASGLMAKKMRGSSAFTVFDGYVPMAGKAMNPYKKDGQVLSANSLQLLAKSPADFFFKYVLELSPPEDEDTDTSVWLDHLGRGSLLHRVFEQCMRGLRDKNELPSYSKHRDFFRTILSMEIKKIRDEYPPLNQYAYERDCFLLEKAVDIFLSREEEFCKTSKPVYFEVPVGIPNRNYADGPGSPDPLALCLPNNKEIRVRAQIDRIDKIGKPDQFFYTVWDYKSGSSSNYNYNDPFRNGRIIQNILYMLIVEKQLGEKVSKNAEVKEVGFFFTSLKELGKRISWPATQLLPGKDFLISLADMLCKGCFPCSDQEDDMKFTDYEDAFIDITRAQQDMARKIGWAKNKHLAIMRALRE